jgi:hypothetical protein
LLAPTVIVSILVSIFAFTTFRKLKRDSFSSQETWGAILGIAVLGGLSMTGACSWDFSCSDPVARNSIVALLGTGAIFVSFGAIPLLLCLLAGQLSGWLLWRIVGRK